MFPSSVTVGVNTIVFLFSTVIFAFASSPPNVAVITPSSPIATEVTYLPEAPSKSTSLAPGSSPLFEWYYTIPDFAPLAKEIPSVTWERIV